MIPKHKKFAGHIRTSNTGSPVSRDSAAISKIMVPAQAVHVSRDDSSLGLLSPYLKLICNTTNPYNHSIFNTNTRTTLTSQVKIY